MKNIFFLPTDQPSKLGYHFDILSSGSIDYAPNFGFDEFNTKNNYQHRPYHLYITSDEEINLGDWLIWRNNVLCDSNRSFTGVDYSECKKILLTTDKKLIADGIQAIDDEFLEWFVKNPSCEYVKTELLNVSEVLWEEYFKKHGVYPKYPYYEKIIIPQEEPKRACTQDVIDAAMKKVSNDVRLPKVVRDGVVKIKQETLEEAAEKYSRTFTECNGTEEFDFMEGAKWQAECSYSEEEVLKIINKFNEIHYHPSEEWEITEWFGQFKKK
jgi:translation initiation factor 2 beta subunit (eIF-2beta)/eIF-5